jgi:putative flippase GtrA
MKIFFASKLAASKKMPVIAQFARFTSAGALGTIVHYLVLLALVSIFSSRPVSASILGSLAGAIVNYLLSHHWIFRSKRKHSETLSKFFAVGGLGLVLNAAIMYALVTIANMHYLLAQVAATGAVLFWNFLGNRFWTFADDTRNI